MLVFKDLISGDEIISDSFDLIDKGPVYEVDCAVVVKGKETFNTGANASAEEAEEALEDGDVQVNNIIDTFRLVDTGALYKDIKAYQGQFKRYLKAVVTKFKEQGKSEEEIKEFQTGVSNYFSKVIKPNFKDYDCYTGESMDHDAMLLLLNYRDDGTTPYFTIWKHPLEGMKV